jgi:ABC-type protease/lipase transport system fused ATPase/permease subunit
MGCVMGNLKGGHKTLTSQFLYHILPVHFERVYFLVSYNMHIKVLIYALICRYFLLSFHTLTDIKSTKINNHIEF